MFVGPSDQLKESHYAPICQNGNHIRQSGQKYVMSSRLQRIKQFGQFGAITGS